MWATMAEWCADVFAATSRNRRGATLRLYLGIALAIGAALIGLASRGLRGLLPIGVAATLALLVARDVFAAREAVWRAARLPLDGAGQRPVRHAHDRLAAPTSLALHALASAIDSARRSRYAEAHDLARLVARDLLLPEETRLLDAVRAMVSLGLGDTRRAAQMAAVALPTGSDELDSALGRAMVTSAWSSRERLAAIEDAWRTSGVGEDDENLGRLLSLVRIRLDGAGMADLSPADARDLYEEARALGDDELAGELDARARSSTYR